MVVTGALDFFMESDTPQGALNFYTDWQDQGVRQRLLYGQTADKATYLQQLSAELNCPHERIHQSLNPDLLEAVYLPCQQLTVLDGDRIPLTAPYLPRQYCTLSCDINEQDFLLAHHEALPVDQKIHAYRKQFQTLLKTANALFDSNRGLLAPFIDQQKLQRQAVKLAELACKKATTGAMQSRFVSAFTAQGATRFDSTLQTISEQVIAIHDDSRVCAPLMLAIIEQWLCAKSIACYRCYSPFVGAQELEGILVPSTQFAIITTDRLFTTDLPCKRIHATRFIDNHVFKLKKQRLKFCKKTALSLLDEGILALQQANRLQISLQHLL